jgi:hypothetical protein
MEAIPYRDWLLLITGAPDHKRVFLNVNIKQLKEIDLGMEF